MVKNPPANAEDMGLVPGPGGSHMLWGTKPVHHSYSARAPRACALQPEKPLRGEVHASQLEWPLLQLEKARVQQQRPRAARSKNK